MLINCLPFDRNRNKKEDIYYFAVFAGRPALSYADERESDPEPTVVSDSNTRALARFIMMCS